ETRVANGARAPRAESVRRGLLVDVEIDQSQIQRTFVFWQTSVGRAWVCSECPFSQSHHYPDHSAAQKEATITCQQIEPLAPPWQHDGELRIFRAAPRTR